MRKDKIEGEWKLRQRRNLIQRGDWGIAQNWTHVIVYMPNGVWPLECSSK